ncbi:MAG: MYG1 family protein, partial [Chlamydiae bacterium]|nr:MYG1 family protein [Chlamydiota bacterium]
MQTSILPRSFGTHDGAFHADEVTACAFLLLYNLIDRDKIVRTRDLAILKNLQYVCDVGGIYDANILRFDHHQVEYKGGLSSAGMVLQYLADQRILTEELYHYFNNSLVIGVDAVDNGQATQKLGHCSFSSIITNFVPANHGVDDTVLFKAFEEALDFTFGHLQRLQERFMYIRSCKEKVKESMQRGQEYLEFDEAIPWMENFFELEGESHPALFVVMPSGPHWKLRGIPPSYDQKMKVRKSLPKHWAGLLEQELGKVTKIPGAIFCHKGRFISIWKTKEDALKALYMVL